MLRVGTADECAEVDVKFLAAVARDGSADGPHEREQEESLQPQRDLRAEKEKNNVKQGRSQMELTLTVLWNQKHMRLDTECRNVLQRT